MANAITQFYLCNEVVSRTDIMPLLTQSFEGEMGLVEALIGLSEHVDAGYDKWCADNGSDNFCGVFDYEVTPVVANRVVDFMLTNKHAPTGPVVTEWTVQAMDAANAALGF